MQDCTSLGTRNGIAQFPRVFVFYLSTPPLKSWDFSTGYSLSVMLSFWIVFTLMREYFSCVVNCALILCVLLRTIILTIAKQRINLAFIRDMEPEISDSGSWFSIIKAPQTGFYLRAL